MLCRGRNAQAFGGVKVSLVRHVVRTVGIERRNFETNDNKAFLEGATTNKAKMPEGSRRRLGVTWEAWRRRERNTPPFPYHGLALVAWIADHFHKLLCVCCEHAFEHGFWIDVF